MNARDALIYLSMKYEGDWEKMIEAVRHREDVPEQLPSEMKPKSGVVLITEETYPEALKHANRPPLVLYYYGDVTLLGADPKIAYIGTRDASEYGIEMAKKLCSGIAKRNYVLVTGLGSGIEAAGAEAALKAKGKVIAVLANGIDFCYPATSQTLYETIKKKGLVLSEYPLTTPPTADRFPMRSRLVAALAKGIIVGEDHQAGYSMIDVSFALGTNTEVGCVPFRASDDEGAGCNKLIKEGAMMIDSIEDIDAMVGNDL